MNSQYDENLKAKLDEATQFILSKSPQFSSSIGLILGSGLGPIVDQMKVLAEIPYSEIPYFHGTTVVGHQGRFVCAELDGTPLYVMQGRIHAYEGHSLNDVVFPIRLLKYLNAQYVVLTNAAGGINTDYTPGQLVLIKDQLNFTGQNPLVGQNHDFLGDRFPDMSEIYPKGLRSVFKEAALKLNSKLAEGVYAGVLGPSYETPSEIRMLRGLGADLVGMSTVPEAIAGHHAGLQLIGLSCVTNMAAGVLQQKLNHDDIKNEANKAMNHLGELLKIALKEINS